MLFGFAIFGFALFDFALFGFAHFGFALFGFALFAQGHRLTQCSLSLQIQTITVKNQEFGLSREEHPTARHAGAEPAQTAHLQLLLFSVKPTCTFPMHCRPSGCPHAGSLLL